MAARRSRTESSSGDGHTGGRSRRIEAGCRVARVLDMAFRYFQSRFVAMSAPSRMTRNFSHWMLS